MSLLTENEVVDIVCEWLKDHGYRIEGFCHDTTQGDDIRATAPDGVTLLVECKGARSKTGNEFASKDVWTKAAGAFFNTVRASERVSNVRHGIAVPDTSLYREMFSGLEPFFRRHALVLFWIAGANKISVWGDA